MAANSIVTAAIAAAAITGTQIANGAISTSLLIADNVIVKGHILADNATKVTSSGNSSIGISYNNTLQTLHTMTVVSSGFKTTFFASIDCDIDVGTKSGALNTWDFDCRLYIDGADVGAIVKVSTRVNNWSGGSASTNFGHRGTFTGVLVYTPSIGSRTVALKVQPANNGGTVTFGSATITALECMKAS
jgi:hypothetical protein